MFTVLHELLVPIQFRDVDGNFPKRYVRVKNTYYTHIWDNMLIEDESGNPIGLDNYPPELHDTIINTVRESIASVAMAIGGPRPHISITSSDPITNVSTNMVYNTNTTSILSEATAG